MIVRGMHIQWEMKYAQFYSSIPASQSSWSVCRSKMRMSDLSKVERSAFLGGRGLNGNGANRLEPTRTGPAARATRGQAKADHADRGRQTAGSAIGTSANSRHNSMTSSAQEVSGRGRSAF